VRGHEILAGSKSPLVQLAAEVAYSHHERWDGTGYPLGMTAHSIPVSARIVAVADVFDALMSERVYKLAWSTIDSANYVIAGRGTQFEPDVVDAFIRVLLRREPSLAPAIDRSMLS
jgi:putative two-component system response regulator